MQHEKMKQLFAGTGINCLKTEQKIRDCSASASGRAHRASDCSQRQSQWRNSSRLRQPCSQRQRPRSEQNYSDLSQSSRLISLRTNLLPAPSPCSHQLATDTAEEFSPLSATVSSNRALRTPSRLAEHHLCHSVTWYEKCVHVVSAHHKSADTLDRLGASCVRRTRSGAAMTLCVAARQCPCAALSQQTRHA